MLFATMRLFFVKRVLTLLGPDADSDAVRELASRLGLGQPAITRYSHWIGGLLTRDLGTVSGAVCRRTPQPRRRCGYHRADPDWHCPTQLLAHHFSDHVFLDLFQPTPGKRIPGVVRRLLANDAVHALLYQPQWITVAHKNLKGLWKDMPVFVNDLSTLSWS